MRVERLVESRAAVLELSPSEATELSSVGRRLAADVGWSRTSETDHEGGRSAIECVPYGHGRWSVRVHNAVGVVRVESLQLVVEPKVPLPHLMYLFERSGAFPRIDTSAADLSTAESLWSLVASWYVASLERLLRSGLSSGYRHTRDELPAARGRLVTASTSRSFLKGRLLMECEYEEFDVDTPLNRVLKAAAVAITSSAALSWDVRRRGVRAVDHMESVGRLVGTDLKEAVPERHTSRYALPLQLAKHVLAATGRGIEAGPEHGYAFLLRTPELVEEGLRRIAAEALADQTSVTKQTWFLPGSHHSLTPDLLFGSQAIGDVKYKLWPGDWDRGDLYQLVAFATGFGVIDAVRLGFASAEHGPSIVAVGPVRLEACDWTSEPTVSPIDAERAFVSRLRAWWSETRRRAESAGGLYPDAASSR